MVTTNIGTGSVSSLPASAQPGTSITVFNPLDGNGTPGTIPSNVSFTIDAGAPLTPGNGLTIATAASGQLSINLSSGNNFISIDNMPWAYDWDNALTQVPENNSLVGVRYISTGSGNDTILLNRVGINQTLNSGGGDDYVRMENAFARDVKLGDGNDTLIIRVDSENVSEAEVATKALALQNGRGPTLEGQGGMDELRLEGQWTLVSGNATNKFTLIDDTTTESLAYSQASLVKFFPTVIDGTIFYPPLTAGTLVQPLSIRVTGFETVRLICFTSGMMLNTPKGEVAIDDLFVGDIIETRRGPRAIRWIGSRRMDRHDLTQNPKMAPVVIPAHAFGENCPSEPLKFSPQHRIVTRSNIAKSLFGYAEAFVAAKHLIGFNGIETDYSVKEVTYFHIMLDEHEVVNVSGLDVETLYPGPQAMEMMDPDARAEISMLFPHLLSSDGEAKRFESCYPFLTGRDAKALIARHAKSNNYCLQAGDISAR